MNQAPALRCHHLPVTDAVLQVTLETLLRRRAGHPIHIAHLERRPSSYRTSATLEELDVELAGGRRLQMMFKKTDRESMHGEAQRIKPTFVHNPLREIETYRRVLAGHRRGTAECYGAVADRQSRRFWLFLERVPGLELYQVGELATWREVARWLAATHVSFARAGIPGRAAEIHALRFTRDYYRLWLNRARRLFADDLTPADNVSERLEWLAVRHEAVVERLAVLPTTFIHGEFYASNVLVQKGQAGVRVCPVDWEMAAIGPGLMDLAALTAGDWSDGARLEIAMAYRDALREHGGISISQKDLVLDLSCCRIQLAVQWLGWFGRRRPPVEHARDWLEEATRLAAHVRH